MLKESIAINLSLFMGSLRNERIELEAPLKKIRIEGYNADPIRIQVLKMIVDKIQQSKAISLGECSNNSLLESHGGFYMPDHYPLKFVMLQAHHDLLPTGHSGRSKAFELISCNY